MTAVRARRSSRRVRAVVPEWAKDAIWYQVFPERFRNGLRANDPCVEDIADHPIPGWRVKKWGSDWYALDPWEADLGGFRKAVYHRRYGGDLCGLREKLDYLQDLGINAIYLNPVFMAPSLHKYDASCLHHVDPTLGPDRAGDLDLLARAGETEDPGTWIWTAADRYLLDLVADIHRRGMRIILDGVFNHVGTRFFAFRDVCRNGRASRFRRWFRIEKWHRDGTFEYRGWFGHKTLPELARSEKDLALPVKKYLHAITKRWMDPNADGDPSDGVDGWRLDVAFCVPHGFWKGWRKLVKSINPNAFLTAEVVSRADDYLRGDEFDSVMNYAWLFPVFRFFRPGADAISARKLQRELTALRRAYPGEINLVLQNLLDSHDLGRIATALANRLPAGEKWDSYFALSGVSGNPGLVTTRPRTDTWNVLKQLLIFQMTYPGAPMIYYGTEVGLWGANDPDNRQPMLWADILFEPESHMPHGVGRLTKREPDRALFEFFRKAIRLRRENEVLRRGVFRWMQTGNDRLLGFRRTQDRAEILALFNASDEKATFRLDRGMRDLWNNRRIPRGRISLRERGWLLLVREA